jgi:hypothetical protein
MRRQLNDYIEKFYNPQAERYRLLIKDDFAAAKEISNWKGQNCRKMGWN